MTASLHPASPHDLPAFIAGPGESDVLMAVVAIILVLAVLAVGLLFFRLHTLPERMAHKSQKIQFEIVACWACWPSSRTSMPSGWPACCSP
jgi:apolipoprotein N-acyltransferase